MKENFGKNEERTSEYLEKFNREKVLKLLVNQHDPVIFDIGANNGSSLVEFKKWWPKSIVHCFEPQEECWDDLIECRDKFQENSVRINKFALGNMDDDSKIFFTHDLNSGISGFSRINQESRDSIDLNRMKDDNYQLQNHFNTINHERNVRVKRLDTYIKENKIDGNINLLKLDTQGFEPEILEGIGDSLANVDVVLTELMFYDYYERSLSFSDIERLLHPAGLYLYDISHIAKNPMNGRTDWVDAIYVNRKTR